MRSPNSEAGGLDTRTTTCLKTQKQADALAVECEPFTVLSQIPIQEEKKLSFPLPSLISVQSPTVHTHTFHP